MKKKKNKKKKKNIHVWTQQNSFQGELKAEPQCLWHCLLPYSTAEAYVVWCWIWMIFKLKPYTVTRYISCNFKHYFLCETKSHRAMSKMISFPERTISILAFSCVRVSAGALFICRMASPASRPACSDTLWGWTCNKHRPFIKREREKCFI